jgi:cytoskeletal protein CcmA (bactofilin family)
MTFMRNQGDGTPPIRQRVPLPETEPDTENLLTRGRPERAEAQRPSFATERDPRTLPTPADACANVIGAGSRWKGSLTISDSVRIEGQFSGDVDARGTVHISEGAQVDAKIKAAFVAIAGTFKGEVRCSERLELLPSSRVQGDLITKRFTAHEGALIDGSIRMSEDQVAGSPRAEREGREGNATGGRQRAPAASSTESLT